MQQQELKRAPTTHPFVVRNKDVCNGSPVIEGTRTRVVDIVMEYEMLGHSPDEIVDSYSHLNLSQVHDALSFYYENRSELDRKIEKDQEFVRQLRKTFCSKIALAYGRN